MIAAEVVVTFRGKHISVCQLPTNHRGYNVPQTFCPFPSIIVYPLNSPYISLALSLSVDISSPSLLFILVVCMMYGNAARVSAARRRRRRR